jgi:hypothetical protein
MQRAKNRVIEDFRETWDEGFKYHSSIHQHESGLVHFDILARSALEKFPEDWVNKRLAALLPEASIKSHPVTPRDRRRARSSSRS